ncbi:MAG: hypothetical protein RLZ33_2197 [Bacteroidota bacterium]
MEPLHVKEVAPTTQKYFYPAMSYCGGALYGIYRKKELIRIESTFGAELGYSTQNVEFKNGKIVGIHYREHYADYDKYREKYPNLGVIDPAKVTYSDTLYILSFGKEKSFKTYAGKRLISTKTNEELTNRLLKCAETMQQELNSEKQLVKD